MFKVAREFIREDGAKVAMSVVWETDKVEVSYSLEGSQTVESKTYTVLEAQMLLALLSIAEDPEFLLNP